MLTNMSWYDLEGGLWLEFTLVDDKRPTVE